MGISQKGWETLSKKFSVRNAEKQCGPEKERNTDKRNVWTRKSNESGEDRKKNGRR